jgi:hypothetical protein
MSSEAGNVYHLNTIVPQTGMSISGTCGSPCAGIGQIYVIFWADLGSTYTTCATGWVSWVNGGESCGIETTPQTVLNLPTSYGFMTGCDSFAPGTCAPPSTVNTEIVIEVASTLAVLAQMDNSCGCWELPGFHLYNQKYKITSARNVQPVNMSIGDWTISDFYTWNNVSFSQWCKTTVNPLLTGGSIKYGSISTGTPSAMPGQYINGDVPGISLYDGKVVAIPGENWIFNLTPGSTKQIAIAKAAGSDGIYTWDNTSAARGTGGNPTTACQDRMVRSLGCPNSRHYRMSSSRFRRSGMWRLRSMSMNIRGAQIRRLNLSPLR